MGAIAFSTKHEESWVVAGWAFRQILDDTAAQHPDDSEMAQRFEEAKALSGLIIYVLGPDFATRVTNAIRDVATGILSGKIRSGIVDQRYGDDRTVRQYQEALRELLEAIPTTGIREGAGPPK